MAEYFLIDDIHSKNGNLTEVHKNLIGKKCYIMSLEEKERGIFVYEYTKGDESELHRVLTSEIICCARGRDGTVELETENAFYSFKPYLS